MEAQKIGVGATQHRPTLSITARGWMDGQCGGVRRSECLPADRWCALYSRLIFFTTKLYTFLSSVAFSVSKNSQNFS